MACRGRHSDVSLGGRALWGQPRISQGNAPLLTTIRTSSRPLSVAGETEHQAEARASGHGPCGADLKRRLTSCEGQAHRREDHFVILNLLPIVKAKLAAEKNKSLLDSRPPIEVKPLNRNRTYVGYGGHPPEEESAAGERAGRENSEGQVFPAGGKRLGPGGVLRPMGTSTRPSKDPLVKHLDRQLDRRQADHVSFQTLSQIVHWEKEAVALSKLKDHRILFPAHCPAMPNPTPAAKSNYSLMSRVAWSIGRSDGSSGLSNRLCSTAVAKNRERKTEEPFDCL